MPIYLITVTIDEGEHEYPSYTLIKAKTREDALKIVDGELDKQENEPLLGEEDENESKIGYWSWGDGRTQTKFQSIKEITPDEAKILKRLDIGFLYNDL